VLLPLALSVGARSCQCFRLQWHRQELLVKSQSYTRCPQLSRDKGSVLRVAQGVMAYGAGCVAWKSKCIMIGWQNNKSADLKLADRLNLFSANTTHNLIIHDCLGDTINVVATKPDIPSAPQGQQHKLYSTHSDDCLGLEGRHSVLVTTLL